MDTAFIISGLTVFVLALFAGAELIARVPQTLHTPLMSGSNAISGIAILGALLVAGHSDGLDSTSLIGMLAVMFAAINVAGGYLVTHRMLQMFKKKEKRGA
ncbi:MAG: NAD(P) transhydrogenase subunit alpha [Desulfobacteraceae bacterium]|nr:MAG: NAD(P) transhydrogenase subunit alpha [Desulfobacteraceae bacterium]